MMNQYGDRYSEQCYIEQKLIANNNHKSIKITEEDITMFEDGQITKNTMNLFIE